MRRTKNVIAMSAGAIALSAVWTNQAAAVSQPPKPYYVNSPNGAIAYSNASDNGRSIHAVAADGTDSTLYTTSGCNQVDQVLASPGSTQIAFLQLSTTSADCSTVVGQLLVAGNDGSGVRVLVPSGAQQAAWSPDGSKIAVVRYSASGGQQVFLVNADGSGTTGPLGSAHYVDDLAWSPDGTTLAYQDYAGTTSDHVVHRTVGLIAPDGTGARTLVADTAVPFSNGTRLVGDLVWDSNTELVLATSTTSSDAGPCRLTGLTTDTKQVRTVAVPPTADACGFVGHASLVASPDLSTLAYTTTTTHGATTAYEVAATGGDSVAVTTNAWGVAWERIVYGTPPRRGRR